MITTTVTMPGELTVTVSCEYSDDIRTVIREVMLGLKDYADECNDQNKNDKFMEAMPHKGGSSSVECAGETTMRYIICQLDHDIDNYGEVTLADLKHYANVTPVYIRDRHLGVNRKRDIVGSATVDGYKITMKNLIEVD